MALSTQAACCSRVAASIPATAASPCTEKPPPCTAGRSRGQSSSLPSEVDGRTGRTSVRAPASASAGEYEIPRFTRNHQAVPQSQVEHTRFRKI